MAAPAYATDLTTDLVGNLGTETWDESSDAGYDDAGAMVDDINLYYINTSCVSAQFTKDGIGSIIGSIGATITVPTDGAILMHHLWAAPAALSNFTGGGVRMLIGDSFGDFNVFYVSGSDKAPAPEGGWETYAVDPAQTPQGTVVGSPAVISYIGSAVAATAQARGNPHAVNAIRHGRCEQEYTLGELATPAIFGGYAAIDSTTTTRYNLLQPIKGGYQQRGLVSLGTTATAVYFDDANLNISLADDVNVSANFNRWEVNNASSEVYMTAISVSALGITSKGRFVVVDNAIVEKTSCTFTDMDYFTYQSNSTLLTTTYRRCGLVTQGGATITNVTFDAPSGTTGLSADILNSVTKCTFNSDGTGYAVDIGTVDTVSVNWDNYESGYVVGVTGTDVGVTPTGNETILVSVNAGEVLTVNVQTGASTPSIANAGTGTVNVVAGLVTADWTINPSITGYEYAIYTVTAVGSLEGSAEVQHVESTVSDSFSYTYTYSAGVVVAVQIIDDGTHDFEENVTYYPLSASNQSFTINLDADTNN